MAFDKQAALRAGYTEEEINEFLRGKIQGGTPQKQGVRYATDVGETDSALTKFAKFFARPAEKYGRFVAEAGAQAFRFGTDPIFRKAVLGQKLTPQEASELTKQKPTYFLKQEEVEDRKKIAETGAKAIAGAMSYFIPAGKTLKTAVGLGVVGGGLRAASEDEITPEGIIAGMAGGGIAGGAFYGAGKIVGKSAELVRKGKTKVGEKAAETYMKTSPSAYRRAIEEHGVDLRKLVQKYVPSGKGYDDMLGVPSERGRGGILKEVLDEAEGQIKQVSELSGTNIKISGDDVLSALKREANDISKNLGDQTKRDALKRIIAEAEKKYAGGITVKQALKTLRAANSKFGKAVVQTQKGATVASAQKLEANTLRSVLKQMFPELKDALRTQEEVLTFMPILQQARAKGATSGVSTRMLKNVAGLVPESAKSTLAQVGTKTPAESIARNQAIKEVIARGTQLAGGKIGAEAQKPQAPAFTTGEPAVQLPSQGQQGKEILSPGGQWRWDSKQNDWVPSGGGVQGQGNIPTKEEFNQAILNDLQTTGGKNVSKLKTAYEFLVGSGEGLTAVQSNKVSQIATGEILLDRLEEMLGQIPSSSFGPTARLTGTAKNLFSQLGLDPKVSTYNDVREGTMSLLVRALGEVGTLNEGDIKRAVNLVPKVTDTPQERTLNIQQLKAILNQVKEAIKQQNVMPSTESTINEDLFFAQ